MVYWLDWSLLIIFFIIFSLMFYFFSSTFSTLIYFFTTCCSPLCVALIVSIRSSSKLETNSLANKALPMFDVLYMNSTGVVIVNALLQTRDVPHSWDLKLNRHQSELRIQKLHFVKMQHTVVMPSILTGEALMELKHSKSSIRTQTK